MRVTRPANETTGISPGKLSSGALSVPYAVPALDEWQLSRHSYLHDTSPQRAAAGAGGSRSANDASATAAPPTSTTSGGVGEGQQTGAGALGTAVPTSTRGRLLKTSAGVLRGLGAPIVAPSLTGMRSVPSPPSRHRMAAAGAAGGIAGGIGILGAVGTTFRGLNPGPGGALRSPTIQQPQRTAGGSVLPGAAPPSGSVSARVLPSGSVAALCQGAQPAVNGVIGGSSFQTSFVQQGSFQQREKTNFFSSNGQPSVGAGVPGGSSSDALSAVPTPGGLSEAEAAPIPAGGVSGGGVAPRFGLGTSTSPAPMFLHKRFQSPVRGFVSPTGIRPQSPTGAALQQVQLKLAYPRKAVGTEANGAEGAMSSRYSFGFYEMGREDGQGAVNMEIMQLQENHSF